MYRYLKFNLSIGKKLVPRSPDSYRESGVEEEAVLFLISARS